MHKETTNQKEKNIMKIINKFLFVAASLFALATANAYEDPCKPEPCCPEPPPCCEIPGCPTTPAYNQSASIDVCGAWDFFATATFLWIQPIQEQMDPAYTEYGSQTTYKDILHKFDFDGKAAFKVGLGWNYEYDKWDTFIQYTRINTGMTTTVKLTSTGSPTLYGTFLTQSLPDYGTLREVKQKWDLDFNIFDLELGRPYYNGTKLTFRAHYGIKAGWIDQKINATHKDTTANTLVTGDFESKSWLVGPRAGIQTNWMLGEGFRLFGNAAASLFYQKFHKLEKTEPYYYNDTQWYDARQRPSSGFINANLEALLGVGYGTYFSRNNWHFDMIVGYEAQLFFNQNMIRYLVEAYADLIKPGNLAFHGLNVSVRFDF